MFRSSIAIAILVGSHGALAAGGTDSVNPGQDAPPPITPIAPIVVEGDEPRYVAPTLRDRIGRIWAPVLINGKGPYRLVLDTGANSSAIVPSVAKSLGVPLHSRKVQLHGVTGSAIVPIIMADSIEIGDLFVSGATLPIVADVFGGAEGVLGPKGLGDKRIHIDFGNDMIEISRSRNQSLPAGYTRVPIKFTEGQLLSFDIRIGTIRTKAILDTGAQLTLGNTALREALLRRKREGIDQNIVGVTLDVQSGQSFAVPTIALGGIEVRNMRVVFGDMFIFEQWKMTEDPAILIGMDVIGSLDTLIIDYRQRELHLRARR
jgi:predicted aspartyl protease